MNLRVLAGSLLAYLYNGIIGRVPSHVLRELYLRGYLGAYGSGTSVQMGCSFLNGRKVCFGERNVVNFGCLFDGRRYKIVTGNDVSIGPEASILTLGHDPQSPSFELRGGDVVIGNHAWIGYRALILPRLTIGEGAVVAAGAVVTKNVEPYSIVAGNPARVIGQRNRDLKYALNFRPPLQ
jgi:acetyltransferase-like isoleucine patch superfamily enzyme